MTEILETEVLIIGAGPSGCSAASILAEKGHRVLILERDVFPRYRVGESLIPFTYQPLERIGMIPKMKASHFMKKYSVCFVQPDGRASDPFYFFTRYDRDTVAQSWQVLRSDFDVMMRDNAIEKGASVHEGVEVKELVYEEGRVTGARAVDRDGKPFEVRATITLDCSGKEAFSSNRQAWRVGDPYLNKVAVWTYYEGAKREAGIDEGATTVAFVPEKGWFWYIPQHGDRVSVGVVAEGKYLTREGVKDPKVIFDREIENNRWIADHLSCGRQVGEYYLTSEYSRYSKYGAAPGLLLVGDAFAFLDPVFSSGIMLALKSGVMAGDYVHEGLQTGDLSPAHFTGYSESLREGIENMRKLVYAFYDPHFSFRDLIKRYPETADELTDCLSGDVNRDFSSLWSKIGEFVTLPEELPYGMPMQAA
ncbi:MAG: tryptophan 7-halogenase [Verrucomicrobiae bacterium]|nr:tryptophan 7-halogenase [Verrucomicrobiae bacterium]